MNVECENYQCFQKHIDRGIEVVLAPIIGQVSARAEPN